MRHLVVHPLPVAPAFTGRTAELESLRQAIVHDTDARVVSLVGIGGAGKTAIAADPDTPRPDSLFVWSFYVDQLVEALTNDLRATPERCPECGRSAVVR